MTRLAAFLFAAFITLHTPSGREVYVNADEIMVVSDGGPPLTTRGCKSDVLVHDKWICVVEAPGQVLRIVEGSKQ